MTVAGRAVDGSGSDDAVRRPKAGAGDGRPPSGRATLGRSYAVTLLGSVGFLAFTLYTGVLSARLLAPDGRGAVGAIAGWAMLVTFIGGVGLREGMSWTEARHRRLAPTVLTSTLVASFCLALIAIGVAQILIPFGFRAQADSVIFYARVSMFWVLPYMVYNALGSIFGARQRFAAVTAMRVGQPFLYAIGLTVAWWGNWASVSQVIAIQVVSFVVPALVALVILARESGFGRFDWTLTRGAAAFGIRAFGSTFGAMANSRLDILILPAILVASEIGLYVVAASAATMIVGLFGSLSLVVFPAAARVGGPQAIALAQRAIRIVLLASVILAIILGGLASWLVRLLYGDDFAGAVTPLRILLPGVCCWATVSIVGSSLKAINRPSAASISQFVGVGVTIVGLALLVRPLGIVGAALTSTVSYATVLAVGVMLFARATGTTVRSTIGPGSVLREGIWLIRRATSTMSARFRPRNVK